MLSPDEGVSYDLELRCNTVSAKKKVLSFSAISMKLVLWTKMNPRAQESRRGRKSRSISRPWNDSDQLERSTNSGSVSGSDWAGPNFSCLIGGSKPSNCLLFPLVQMLHNSHCISLWLQKKCHIVISSTTINKAAGHVQK